MSTVPSKDYRRASDSSPCSSTSRAMHSRRPPTIWSYRSRRVQRFFTQPFSSAEPWTGTLGQHVSLTETIRGCQAILAGQYDHLPEEAFYFVGTLDQVVAKAKHM